MRKVLAVLVAKYTTPISMLQTQAAMAAVAAVCRLSITTPPILTAFTAAQLAALLVVVHALFVIRMATGVLGA
jgi:hypothetical protein